MSNRKPQFVIQQHDASTLHYDFRIEVDGVLKSWAVPKGPSTDPAEKRLAIPTDDHRLDYAEFEGVIPEGEYGAGTVLVWDRGPYRNITEKDGETQPAEKALAAGHLLIELEGDKISGGYALHRTGSGDNARWLLIKTDDEHADARRNPVSTEPESVKSGRTIEQIAEEENNDGERVIEANGHKIAIGHPGKLLFESPDITKFELAGYYRRIAGVALRHYRDRALSMHRYPDGIESEGFFQKNVGEHFPDWVERKTLPKEGGEVTHVVANNAATLVYLADQACITPHLALSRIDRPDHPDRMIFDLDPSDDPSDNNFDKVRQTARYLANFLDELELTSFVQTTGSRGLHVVVPLDSSLGFNRVREFSHRVCRELAGRYPELMTVEQRRNKRGNRVFLDDLRNAYGQTSVAPYAVRARPGAPVATPLNRDEVERTDLDPQQYTIGNIFNRLGQIDDPWANIARHAQGLENARRRLFD